MKTSDQMLVMMSETQRLMERVRAEEINDELAPERRQRIILRAHALQNDLGRLLGGLVETAGRRQPQRGAKVLSIRSRSA